MILWIENLYVNAWWTCTISKYLYITFHFLFQLPTFHPKFEFKILKINFLRLYYICMYFYRRERWNKKDPFRIWQFINNEKMGNRRLSMASYSKLIILIFNSVFLILHPTNSQTSLEAERILQNVPRDHLPPYIIQPNPLLIPIGRVKLLAPSIGNSIINEDILKEDGRKLLSCRAVAEREERSERVGSIFPRVCHFGVVLLLTSKK